MRLKLGRQLDYEVEQHILFQGYSTRSFGSHYFLKIVQICLQFRPNPPSFHWFRLKLDGQLDHQVVQVVFFRDHSMPSFDTVITIFKRVFTNDLVYI